MLVYTFWYDEVMADEDLEQQIEAQEKGVYNLKDNLKYLTAKKKALEARKVALADELTALQNANNFSAKFQGLIKENAISNEAVTAANKALSVLGYASLEEEADLIDKAIDEALPKPGRKAAITRFEKFLGVDYQPPVFAIQQWHEKFLEPVDISSLIFWAKFSHVCGVEISYCSTVLFSVGEDLDKVNGILTGRESFFETTMPPKQKLEELKKQLAESRVKKAEIDQIQTRWQERKNDRQQQFQKEGMPKEEAERLAIEQANKEIYEELQKKEEEPVQLPAQRVPVQPVSQPTGQVQPVARRSAPSGGSGWGDWLRHPISTFKDWWGKRGVGSAVQEGVARTGETVAQTLGGGGWRTSLRTFLSTNPFESISNFFRGAKTAGTAAKTAQAVATVAKVGTTAASVGGAAVGGGAVAAGTAAGGIPGIVIAAALLAKKILSSEKVKNIASKLTIAAGAALLWLFLNPGAAIGGIIGATFGGAVGSALLPIFGPLAPAAGSAMGFTAGAFLGYSLQGIASSILGLGGGGGVEVVGAAAPATISVGGFTLPASLSSAASSFGALLSGSGIPSITLVSIGGGIGLVSLFTALTIIAVGATQEQPQVQANEGLLFTVEKTVDKAKLPNNSSSLVTYSVMITAAENIEITKVDDQLTQENKTGSKKLTTPSVTWPAKLSKNETQTVSLAYQVSGASYNDSNLVNVVEVTAGSASKTETLTARAIVAVGTPDYTADRCQLGLDSGYCAVSKLLPYFSDQAENASRVCVAESEGMKNPSRLGKPDKINDSCTTSLSPEKMREYSVGLFQINLWAHDNFCEEILSGQTPFRKPYYAKCTYPDCTPCDRDEDLLKQCKDYWIQPEHNYEAAKRLLDGRKGSWVDWTVARAEYCNIP